MWNYMAALVITTKTICNEIDEETISKWNHFPDSLLNYQQAFSNNRFA